MTFCTSCEPGLLAGESGSKVPSSSSCEDPEFFWFEKKELFSISKIKTLRVRRRHVKSLLWFCFLCRACNGGKLPAALFTANLWHSSGGKMSTKGLQVANWGSERKIKAKNAPAANKTHLLHRVQREELQSSVCHPLNFHAHQSRSCSLGIESSSTR